MVVVGVMVGVIGFAAILPEGRSNSNFWGFLFLFIRHVFVCPSGLVLVLFNVFINDVCDFVCNSICPLFVTI